MYTVLPITTSGGQFSRARTAGTTDKDGAKSVPPPPLLLDDDDPFDFAFAWGGGGVRSAGANGARQYE